MCLTHVVQALESFSRKFQCMYKVATFHLKWEQFTSEALNEIRQHGSRQLFKISRM